MKVIIKPRAQRSISNIGFHIAGKGYPETALKFVTRLEEFVVTLADFPDKTLFPVIKRLPGNNSDKQFLRKITLFFIRL